MDFGNIDGIIEDLLFKGEIFDYFFAFLGLNSLYRCFSRKIMGLFAEIFECLFINI